MNKITAIILGVVVVGAGSFYAGMKYGEGGSARGARGGITGFAGGGLMRGARGGGGGFVAGEIIAKDDQSITVRLNDPRMPAQPEGGSDGQGGSKIVFFTENTQVAKSVSGTSADLSVGETVTVSGAANPDGSVSAQSIQIRPLAPASQRQTNPQASETKEFTVTARNFSFSPATISVKRGDRVKIVLRNTEGFHDWKIDALNAATKRINAGAEDAMEFTADTAGTFEYYCSVGDHRVKGMKGVLIVE